MIQTIEKLKLPKGVAYVLKKTELASALAAAQIETHVDLIFWRPQGGNSILEGHYWLPNENVPYPRVYVRAGVVPNSLRAAAAAALAESALPAFVKWLQDILALPVDSPALRGKPYFNASFTESGLVIANQPVYKVRRRKK